MEILRQAWNRTFGWVAIASVPVLVAAACSGSSADSIVNIFAAASLADAFDELSEEFERRNEGVEVRISYQGSSVLRIQLEQGASSDVFVSADEFNMDLAVAAGVISGDPVTFVRNRLAIVVPLDSARVAGLEDLAKSDVRIVVGADVVPVGRYTTAALRRLGADPNFGSAFRERVEGNIVSKEANVRRAVAKVELGEADVAVGYVTDARGAGRDDLLAIPFPDRYTDEILYQIAVVQGATSPDLAADFIEFALSDEGQRILQRNEFLPALEVS